MKIEDFFNELELKAVAFCEQGDGYLKQWAIEKIAEMTKSPEKQPGV